MLTVLPEVVEDQGADCNKKSPRRCEYGLELLSHTPTVLEFLMQQSEKYYDGITQLHEKNRKILRCLLSWVALLCYALVDRLESVSSLKISALLIVSSLFDLATEVLVELVTRHEAVAAIGTCDLALDVGRKIVCARECKTCNGWNALQCTMCKGTGKVKYKVKNYTLRRGEKATAKSIADAIMKNRAELVHFPAKSIADAIIV